MSWSFHIIIINTQITIITLEGTAENKGKSFVNRLLASASQSKSKQIKTDASSRPSCSIKWQRLNATSTQCILNWIEPLLLGSPFKQDNLQNKTNSTILVSRENHEIYCHATINYKVTIATFSLLLLFASLFALILMLMQLQCKTLLVFSCDPCLAQRVAMQLLSLIHIWRCRRRG